jgi:L-asparagine transporter-like permease
MNALAKSPVRDVSGRRLLLSAVLFFVGYVLALAAAEMRDLPQAARVVMALLPVAVFVWILLQIVAGIRQLDELERRIQLEALAVAYPCALVLMMMLGVLQRVIYLSPQDWSYRHLWPFFVLFYLGGLALARRRYQ